VERTVYSSAKIYSQEWNEPDSGKTKRKWGRKNR